MKNVLIIVMYLAITVAIIYGAYWLVKTVSYNMFYKDMVEETIKELVKPEYLIEEL